MGIPHGRVFVKARKLNLGLIKKCCTASVVIIMTKIIQIRITCLCHVYPLKPHIYIVNLIPIFLIFDLNHRLLVLVRTASR